MGNHYPFLPMALRFFRLFRPLAHGTGITPIRTLHASGFYATHLVYKWSSAALNGIHVTTATYAGDPAFAWNPLLLFEAVVNAHVDATLLILILLAIWFLVRRTPLNIYAYLLAAAMFAVATCVKLNTVLLVPGLLLFLCMQRPWKISHVLATLATYVSTIVLLYIPFWQGTATLSVFLINTAATRDIN